MESSLPPADNYSPNSDDSNQVDIKVALFVITSVVILLISFAYLFYVWQQRRVATPLNLSITESESPLPVSSPEITPSPQIWSTYTDPETGLSFKYPPSVSLFSKALGERKMILWLAVDKIVDIPENMPSSLGRNDAIQQKARLAKGEGEDIVKVSGMNAQVSYTYTQFEVCNVMFARKIIFYPGDYRVVLTLSASPEYITAEMPEFFYSDSATCGEKQIWKQDMLPKFETALVKGEGKGMAQEWYNSFNQIIQSIEISSPAINNEENSSTFD